ncbi:ABC transporter permease [Ructibacterium gallinarum]|uniref:Sugar ABC transporter permease n=1 Tax=Ructibacterium gallinarum TaxID=2779355 RepID=A0A9D5R9N0_9FIRM|nr:ABC transporter permease subunit [Ructibacterium gallinarum]MBE5040674.1 sugar ABC transporter permease [Ructibacterium gallinarum]
MVKHGLTARLKRDLRINKELYLILLVPLIWYVIFKYIPMYGTLMSFQNYNMRLGISGSEWVGLENYRRFFSDPYFSRDIWNTISLSLKGIVVGFPIPIILALLINELTNKTFTKFVQTATYIPHFISMVVICGMLKVFLAKDGVISSMVSLFPGVSIKESLLNNANLFATIFIGSDIWQEAAWGSIIYVAAIAGIDQQLYEAAEIDGAGKFRQMLCVTLPCLAPTIIIMLILRVGAVFTTNNEKILLLINSLNAEKAETLSYYIYKKGITNADYSLSAAAGLFNSIINFVFVIATNFISKHVSETSLW